MNAVVVLVAALGAAACAGSEPDPPGPQPAPRAAADTDIARDVIGIPACDAYVRAMNECYLPRLAAADRDELLAPMKQLRLGWKAAAAGTEDDRAAAAAACTEQLDEHAAALAEHRCPTTREELTR
jgi:hypothetical protein